MDRRQVHIINTMETPPTMDPLTTLMRTMRQGQPAITASTACEALDALSQLCDGVVKIHFDVHDRISAVGRKARGTAFPAFNGATRATIVLTRDRSYDGARNELQRACCGVIIAYPEWRVLARMPQIPDTQFSERDLCAAVDAGAYVVYPMYDATVVTMYYNDEKWKLATANSPDATDFTWMSSRAYGEVVIELLAGTTFDFAKLDRTACYTLAFKHPDFHPLTSEPPFIKLVNAYTRGTDGELDVQTRTADIGLDAIVPVSAPCAYEDITRACSDALRDYKKSGRTCYGFSVVHTDATVPWRHRRDYVIPSTLLNYIEAVAYDGYPPKSGLTTPLRRRAYLCLRALIVGAYREHFLDIFPQYRGQYHLYDEALVRLRGRIIGVIANRNLPAVTPEDLCAHMFARKIAQENINVNSAHSASIIDDFIRDERNLLTLFNYTCTGVDAAIMAETAEHDAVHIAHVRDDAAELTAALAAATVASPVAAATATASTPVRGGASVGGRGRGRGRGDGSERGGSHASPRGVARGRGRK